MKKLFTICAAVLCLTAALTPAAMAAETPEGQVCYPTSVTQSEDGTEIRKIYDLSPEDDPLGISRSDFEQDGYHYTLTDLLKQELPEHEERQHTETVSLQSDKKDMESVLALLPQEKEFVTEDGMIGTLELQLSTVQVEVSGYGSSTKKVTATRSYPNLVNQDTANIPKTITDNGRTLTLETLQWQTDNTASLDGHAERYGIYGGGRNCRGNKCRRRAVLVLCAGILPQWLYNLLGGWTGHLLTECWKSIDSAWIGGYNIKKRRWSKVVYHVDEIRQIVAPIANKYHLKAVYLFGSYARGTATESSDIDLLIDTSGTELKSLFALGALYCDLENALHKPIDLITVSSLEQKTQMQGDLQFRETINQERVSIFDAA